MSVAHRDGAAPPGAVPGAPARLHAGMSSSGQPAAITVTEVSKVFGRGESALLALDRLSLEVAPGEFVCLIGASGCGKSTLLNLVAGLDAATSGEISTGGHRVALMFQEPALFPWLTVSRNVELALQASGVDRGERRRRAASLLELVRLAGFAGKRPHELSGGMRQRAAGRDRDPGGVQGLRPRRNRAAGPGPALARGGAGRVRVSHRRFRLWQEHAAQPGGRPGRHHFR